MNRATSQNPGPLAGVKIVELGGTGPGLSGTTILADMGADVFTVGAPTALGRGTVQAPKDVGRNKRSLSVNLKDDRGKEVLWKLLEGADAFVESFRPGVAKRLGFGYQAVSDRIPGIFYCSLTGYGQSGPDAMAPGHDVMYQGQAGFIRLDEAGNPRHPQTLFADRMATMNLAVALLLGLSAKFRTGTGQYCDLAYVDGVLTIPRASTTPFQGGSAAPGATIGHIHQPVVDGHYPWYQVYGCSDGKYLAVGIDEPWFFERFSSFMGHPEWIGYQWNHEPTRQAMFAVLREKFMTMPRDYWVERIRREADVPIGPVNIGEEVFHDTHLVARGAYQQYKTEIGDVWQIAPVYRMTETPASVWKPMTWEGTDTFEVLREAGFAEDEICDLERVGVIEQGRAPGA